MLSKELLGTDLFTARKAFSNRTWDDLIAEYGTADAIMLAEATADAEAIINHFKTLGLISVTVATTGTAAAQSGGGTGTIS